MCAGSVVDTALAVKPVPNHSMGNVAPVVTRVSIFVVALSLLSGAILSPLLAPEDAKAIPPFARKYDVNCTACHTATPILSPWMPPCHSVFILEGAP